VPAARAGELPAASAPAVPHTSSPAVAPGAFASPAGTLAFHGKAPDGQLDIFISEDGSRAALNLTGHPAEDSAPALSPDGSLVAFQSTRAGKCHLFTIPTAGGSATQLTSGDALDETPCWSPDGKSLYFHSHRGTSWRVCRIPAAGGEVQVLTLDGLDVLAPAVSPDGSSFAAQLREPGSEQWSIGLFTAAGKLLRKLGAPGAAMNETPSFSADGHWLYFAARTAQGYELFKVPSAEPAPPSQVTSWGGWKLHPIEAGRDCLLYDERTPAGWRIGLLDLRTAQRRTLSSSIDAYHPSWRGR
jgi:TolB protein